MAPPQVDVDLGKRRGVGEEVSLLTEVLEGVLGEALELVADGALGRVELPLEGLQRLGRALGDDLVATADLGPVDAQHLAVAHLVHDL